jgi:hypothetical protein
MFIKCYWDLIEIGRVLGKRVVEGGVRGLVRLGLWEITET